MKINDTILAQFYGLTRQRVGKIRKSKEIEDINLYNALVDYYCKSNIE